ncbi:MAG TPA: ATP-binding protein [Anaerolineales bacterium]|nr:ATP-binding protein [Anaerolineales bacterium]
MDDQSASYIRELMEMAVQGDTSREGIERFMLMLRKEFVFDNVAVYLQDGSTQMLEVAYARAIGRSKDAEADAAWGDQFAGQVVRKGKLLLQDPNPDVPSDDRLHQAYLLGLPLRTGGDIRGAAVFVRFGGPVYEEQHIEIASLATEMLSVLFERVASSEMQEELQDLRRQMQLQEDFVSTISHELRTPLGFIKGYSTSLLREDTSWDEQTQKEFLNIIDEEADRLSLLIENVLESARLQSKTLPLRFQPTRLDSVIRDVVLRVRARHKDLDINMQLDSVPPVSGDGVRLAQVFDNLFANAIKYAPGAPIVISLNQVDQDAIISFMDRGPGIPEESLSLIFERFYRARGEKTVTGTGLGLYICRQIIQAHRGKIWAESTPAQGTTFFIQLPIDSAR